MAKTAHFTPATNGAKLRIPNGRKDGTTMTTNDDPRTDGAVHTCACGLAYTDRAWCALELVGYTPAEEDPEGAQLELRNCRCGSTRARRVPTLRYMVRESNRAIRSARAVLGNLAGRTVSAQVTAQDAIEALTDARRIIACVRRTLDDCDRAWRIGPEGAARQLTQAGTLRALSAKLLTVEEAALVALNGYAAR